MIGKILEELRIDRRLSKQSLAKKSGIDRTTIWKIESGKQEPNVNTLSALASALNVDTSIFFGNFDELKQHKKA